MTTPAPTVDRLPIPGGAQMTVRINQNGQQSVVVLGYVTGQAGWPTAAQALAQLERAWTMLKINVSNANTCTGGLLRDVSGDENGAIEIPAPTTPTGAYNGAVAFGAGAVLLKWSTPNGSRSGKGRTFVPGIPAGRLQADGRSIVTADVASINAACTTYLTSSVTAGVLLPAVLSFKRGLAYPITSGAVAPVAGTQRRRMR